MRFLWFEITRAQANHQTSAFVAGLRREAGIVEHTAANAAHKVESEVVAVGHAAGEALRSAEDVVERAFTTAKTAATDDIVRLRQYARSTYARTTLIGDSIAELKGIMTTTAQLVAALTATADQMTKSTEAIKQRDALIAERDTRIVQLEASLLASKAASTDSADLDAAVAVLNAATAAAAVAASAVPKPLTPAAVDNVIPTLTATA